FGPQTSRDRSALTRRDRCLPGARDRNRTAYRLMYLSGTGRSAGLNPETDWSILVCGQAMIEPLARGVDPVQLAFQSLVSMGTRTQRADSPLAAALDRLGVDLARGQSFTT